MKILSATLAPELSDITATPPSLWGRLVKSSTQDLLISDVRAVALRANASAGESFGDCVQFP